MREYRHGDSRRHVHWRASARLGDAVRYYTDEARRIDDRGARAKYVMRAPARHLDGVRERTTKRVQRFRRRFGSGSDTPIANRTAQMAQPIPP